jgi:O-acetyl-ADP-ribose deacetylase (regulator of RNase III)
VIRFVAGDLLAARDLDAIAHGCNCSGAMGKGIALEIRKRWPEMYEAYRERCRRGEFRLGDTFVWKASPVIFNLATQKTYRTRADLGAIEQALRTMLATAEEMGIRRIGIPRIGAGLGGVPWPRVRELLIRHGEPGPIELIVFEEYVPGAEET